MKYLLPSSPHQEEKPMTGSKQNTAYETSIPDPKTSHTRRQFFAKFSAAVVGIAAGTYLVHEYTQAHDTARSAATLESLKESLGEEIAGKVVVIPIPLGIPLDRPARAVAKIHAGAKLKDPSAPIRFDVPVDSVGIKASQLETVLTRLAQWQCQLEQEEGGRANVSLVIHDPQSDSVSANVPRNEMNDLHADICVIYVKKPESLQVVAQCLQDVSLSCKNLAIHHSRSMNDDDWRKEAQHLRSLLHSISDRLLVLSLYVPQDNMHLPSEGLTQYLATAYENIIGDIENPSASNQASPKLLINSEDARSHPFLQALRTRIQTAQIHITDMHR